MEAYADRLDVDKIREAYDFAVEAHAGQRRASGEEYVSHTVEVATILATLRLDSASIISGLIHDTVEDTALSVRRAGSGSGKSLLRLSAMSPPHSEVLIIAEVAQAHDGSLGTAQVCINAVAADRLLAWDDVEGGQGYGGASA